MLNEKQIKLIELLVSGEVLIKDALEQTGIPKSTYYDWRKNETGEFMKAYNEALGFKVDEAKKNIKNNVERYLKTLDDIQSKGKNEQARVNAVGKLFTFAELDPSFKQEINIKDNEEHKNVLLDMLKDNKQVEE